MPGAEPLAVSAPYTYHQFQYAFPDSARAITLYCCNPDNDSGDTDGILWAVERAPIHGSLSAYSDVYPNGVVTYTSEAAFFGTDCFTYYAQSGAARSRTAEVCLHVLAPPYGPPSGMDPPPDRNSINDPPTVYDQVLYMTSGSSIGITLFAYDPDHPRTCEWLCWALSHLPVHGSLSSTGDTYPNGVVGYRSDAGYAGTDTFSYRATDEHGLASAPARILVNILAGERALEMSEDGTLAVSLAGFDLPEGASLSFSILDGPDHGALSGTAPMLTYAPEAQYFGTDGLTFGATGAAAFSYSARITITVNPVNDPPEALPEAYLAYAGHTLSMAAPGVLENDSDPEGDSLSALLDQGPSAGDLSLHADGSFSYTPMAGFYGPDNFLYHAWDGHSSSGTVSVDISVSAPPVWVGTFGGDGVDVTWTIRQISDGGFVMGGFTDSFGAGRTDSTLARTDRFGNVVWDYCYGGTGDDVAGWVVELPASAFSTDGFIIAGETSSFSWSIANTNAWVARIDGAGNVLWAIVMGGDQADGASAAYATTGGFVMTGYTRSLGGGKDSWIFKLDQDGNPLWQKAYGGSNADDTITMPLQTMGGGDFLVAGYSRPSGTGTQMDAWVMKLDSAGGIIWQATYGAANVDKALSIRQIPAASATPDIVLSGSTYAGEANNEDGWVLRLASVDGSAIWQAAYGGLRPEAFNDLEETADGGILVAGFTESFGAGGKDIWVLKLDADGEILWQKAFGGAGDEEAYSIEQASDGNYLIGGATDSFGSGGKDSWIIRLDANGSVLDPLPQGAVTTVTGVSAFPTTVAPNFSGMAETVTGFASYDITDHVMVTDSGQYP